MWWDIFPVGGPAGDPDGGAMDQAILSVMEGMSQHTGLRPELAAYARAARSGCVL
jgi:hypothetical protein